MRRLLLTLTALGAVLTACSDAGGVDPDAIETPELAAVRRALDSALVEDTLYSTLSFLVFPYIDRASHLVTGSDTTRVVGIELDIRSTQGGDSVVADFTAVLGWNGYSSATRTVDSVFFILGAGRAPIDDTLSTTFSPDSAGTGTGFIIHQDADSSVTVWLSRAGGGGRLRTTASSYGAGRTQSGGGIQLTTFRGTLSGDFAITADEVPSSATAASSQLDFGSGARALKVRIRGDLP
ncbi:MAG TPA: hypothetical protein VF978_04535 [Gemmatimonadales bacterium]